MKQSVNRSINITTKARQSQTIVKFNKNRTINQSIDKQTVNKNQQNQGSQQTNKQTLKNENKTINQSIDKQTVNKNRKVKQQTKAVREALHQKLFGTVAIAAVAHQQDGCCKKRFLQVWVQNKLVPPHWQHDLRAGFLSGIVTSTVSRQTLSTELFSLFLRLAASAVAASAGSSLKYFS